MKMYEPQCLKKTRRLETLIGLALSVKALAILSWWALLLLNPEWIPLFHPADWPRASFFAFLPADFLLVSMMIAAAVAVVKQYRWASQSVWLSAVVSMYPTVYCIAVCFITDECWLAASMMGCSSGGLLAIASMVGFTGERIAAFRSVSLSATRSLAVTFAQIVIFWGLFLWLIPKGVAEVESLLWTATLGWVPDWGQSAFTWYFSTFVFMAGSLLGLSSGVTMAVCGHGTPLPTSSAGELVCRGPYAWLRNPMAVAGVMQGVAVGVWLESSWVVLGAFLAGTFWHVAIRPHEEADLAHRMGMPYLQYRERVPLWVPRWRKPVESNAFTSALTRSIS